MVKTKKGMRMRGMPKHNNSYNTPSLMKVVPLPPPVLRVSGSSGRGLLCTFGTPFSREITEALNLRKLKCHLLNRLTEPRILTTI